MPFQGRSIMSSYFSVSFFQSSAYGLDHPMTDSRDYQVIYISSACTAIMHWIPSDHLLHTRTSYSFLVNSAICSASERFSHHRAADSTHPYSALSNLMTVFSSASQYSPYLLSILMSILDIVPSNLMYTFIPVSTSALKIHRQHHTCMPFLVRRYSK